MFLTVHQEVLLCFTITANQCTSDWMGTTQFVLYVTFHRGRGAFNTTDLKEYKGSATVYITKHIDDITD